ncbi:radical SAM protein [Pontiella sp.]|uniref:radical SAM protein n=1 Tax=Pontiella sp. TaxID=2837462 RepID=UPI003567E353
MNSSHSLFRPPAEARSLIIRIQDGCPWNRCTFCGMYKGVNGRFRSMEEIELGIDAARKQYPSARRIFLADGDVMAIPFDPLAAVLGMLNDRFPRLARVNLYANGHSILRKTDGELRTLKRLKLSTLYMGLESGHEPTLRAARKRETAAEMVEAGQRAQAAGLKMSVMVLTGLGGRKNRVAHAAATADALNRMQPRLLSALRVIPIPGTELHAEEQAGTFQQLTEYEAMEELRNMIAGLELESTVFRANHSSNILPMEGRFPKDRPRLLEELDALLASGHLDANAPGAPPLSL